MFSHLISQLQGEIETVHKVLVTNEGLRDLLLTQRAALSALPAEIPTGATDAAVAAHALARLLPLTPDKLDWQIYDHCGALTRLYAVFARFVGELVGEYVRLLPTLYPRYADLPASVTTQHRAGVGHILLKMGGKGAYKKLEEDAVVRGLAAGLSGSPYTLLAEAFFIDRQNLWFDVLSKLFSALGFGYCGSYISRHSEVADFIRRERADSSSAQKELDGFVEYRNEAAHRKVENVLAIDAIAVIGRFLNALGHALADMVEEAVLRRHMELGRYSLVMGISEIHYEGHVVIGTLGAGVRIAVGDEVIVCAGNACQRASMETIQIDGRPVQEWTGDSTTQVGLRVSKRAPQGAELRKLHIPPQVPQAMELQLEVPLPAILDAADTDVAPAAEAGSPDPASAGDPGEAG